VLVVEDNPDILRLLNLELSQEHSVYVARDGRQGYELALREEPDVILTDYMMPEMDGLTLIARVRESARLSGTPIIMLTAKSDLEHRLAAAEAGADAYLPKPFSPREVTAAVNSLLKRRGREVATISLAHEIHNPLAYIRNANTVITENVEKLLKAVDNLELPAEERERRIQNSRSRLERSTAIADQGVRRIAQIVELVRRYARAGYNPEPICFSVDASVGDVLELVHRPSPGVRITTELGAGSALLPVRPEELHLVCRNIVQNAVEAVGESGTVSIVSRRDEQQVVIEVRDDGPGISREHIHRVFTPFFSTKAPGQGMGIGLAIAFQIVDQAGGSIVVASSPGAGATFTIRLPILAGPTPALTEGTP
jgi:signal transduction histidine kinase